MALYQCLIPLSNKPYYDIIFLTELIGKLYHFKEWSLGLHFWSNVIQSNFLYWSTKV